MQDEQKFTEYLKSRNANLDTIAGSIELMNQFEAFTKNYTYDPMDDQLEDIKTFCTGHIAGKENALEKIITLVRYNMLIMREGAVAYLITMLGTLQVLESIEERMRELIGENETKVIFNRIEKPPLGSQYESYPPVIKSLLDSMQNNLSIHKVRDILAGNHHKIPLETFEEDKKKYEELGSIDKFLDYAHQKLLQELEHCMLANELWYEQKITPAVLEFVRSNREIQTGIREGNKLYITKIPYMPDAFLKETDHIKKRFLSCHCPFVRSSIADGSVNIPQLWCYCTGGFIKLRYDVIFGKPLEVEVLETVLNGVEHCRFVITLPPETKY